MFLNLILKFTVHCQFHVLVRGLSPIRTKEAISERLFVRNMDFFAHSISYFKVSN